MSRRISISERAAREYLDGSDARLRAEVERGLKWLGPTRRQRRALKKWEALDSEPLSTSVLAAPAHKSRKPSRAEKREARAAIREKVFARAAETNDDPTDHYQRCEGPKHHNPEKGGRCTAEASELAHVFGRGKGRLPESERTCLALCHWCHKRETMNAPSGAAWWVFFAALFTRLGWTFEATEAQKRAHFESTRSKLGAGLKERRE
jgi:hypothetical protein